MKLNFKKAGLLLTGILGSVGVFAQTADTALSSKDYIKPFSAETSFRTWSIGFGAGVLTPYTIFGTNNKQDFTSPGTKLGYSAYIKRQITSGLGLQLDYLGGKLTAANSQVDNFGKTLDSYETSLHYAISLSANVSVGNITWRNNKNAIQPYLTAGGGFMDYTPVITRNGVAKNFKNTDNGVIREFFIPVGVGVKFNVARGVNLDLGYQTNFVYADNADGFNYGANNDRFSYAHAGLEFALGGRSKPQLASHNPVSSMRTEYLTQGQDIRNMVQTQIDTLKSQNEQLKTDLAATKDILTKLTTDSDGDGVPDFYDKCPDSPAGTKVDGSGCPLPVAKDVKVYVTDADRKVVKDAIQNLEFDFGKATIRSRSYASLDRVADLLISKNFSLKLAGHTDNVGSDDANLRLSKERAESVKAYLVSKGVNPSRIEATGYGETQPIASNKTAKGRQMNRRVEFTLY
ncbi:MAG TPA: DUF6089 family protein [Mucilaginibacter sp.]|nr:DUF6089 family protein [Mucilaginibacter sp.]